MWHGKNLNSWRRNPFGKDQSLSPLWGKRSAFLLEEFIIKKNYFWSTHCFSFSLWWQRDVLAPVSRHVLQVMVCWWHINCLAMEMIDVTQACISGEAGRWPDAYLPKKDHMGPVFIPVCEHYREKRQKETWGCTFSSWWFPVVVFTNVKSQGEMNGLVTHC